MNFNICFADLVLLEFIFLILIFFKILKSVVQKFATQCKQSWYKVFVPMLLKLQVDSL